MYFLFSLFCVNNVICMKIFRFLLVLCGTLFASMGLAGEIDGMRFIHIGLEEGLSHSTIFGIRIKKAICGLPLMTDLINMTVIILLSTGISIRIRRV